MTFKSIKGTKDLLPDESGRWLHLEAVIREVMTAYRYAEIRTPTFEETAVFSRGIGEETDIVGKEMYTFTDKGGSSLTLRPEMTASVVRAYIQHSLAEQGGVTKVYYIGPMYRQERPQAGRLRQFHQFGAECIGAAAPACDADIIAIAADIYARLGIRCTLKLNSVGDPVCRPKYREVLQAYLAGVHDRLTLESQRRAETNPMRVLDSKAPQDIDATMDAPSILDHLSDESRAHFDAVRACLDDFGIPYVIDPRLVRGLDYYTKTAFEFVSTDLGSQDALGGGGRYDGLTEQLGGKATPAVGFAAGMERLLMVLEKSGYTFPSDALSVYIVGLDERSRRWSHVQAVRLRREGIPAECDFTGRSLKAQMREANKRGARHVVIVGEEEMASQRAIVKTMETGEQQSIEFASLLSYFLRLPVSPNSDASAYVSTH
ncbi:MAG: histidine--tRNA ligase [Ignavibacteria bacterium]|nr:histidine--tRNA ligase [Ignavibacteria bacterium]